MLAATEPLLHRRFKLNQEREGSPPPRGSTRSGMGFRMAWSLPEGIPKMRTSLLMMERSNVVNTGATWRGWTGIWFEGRAGSRPWMGCISNRSCARPNGGSIGGDLHLPRKGIGIQGCDDIFGGQGDWVDPPVELVEEERGRGADRVGENQLREAHYLVGSRTATILLGYSANAGIRPMADMSGMRALPLGKLRVNKHIGDLPLIALARAAALLEVGGDPHLLKMERISVGVANSTTFFVLSGIEST